MSTSRPSQPTSTPLPIQNTQLKLEDLQQPGLPLLNTLLAQIQQQIAALSGSNGKTVLPSGIDVAGSTVSGVGKPQLPSDAISLTHAESNYSAAAIAPQLESGGRFSLKTVRNLNSRAQSESNTTYLNRISNTTPTCNTSIISATAPSGGSIDITITAGFHKFPDGSIITYGQFTDTVSVSPAQAITSLARVSGLVTATGTFSGLTAGESINESGAVDSSFDGTFVLLSASGTTLTWSQTGLPDATTTGGSASTLGVYHFYLKNPSHQLAVSGPFPIDSQENRLDANVDQQVLICVATVDGGGLVLEQSAAGATPPAQTGNSRLINRL